ncbi:MAG TPA: PIG-L deacetylase family protein [Mycobacteriales bacterium]|nr:PIG-L deacetylase family protein [Mycobacteriales bacterium]
MHLVLEDYTSVLAVVAHPDDAEYLFGGFIAKLSKQGATINYVVCTDGARSGSDLEASDAQIAGTRAAEQRAAAEILGVSDISFLGYSNGSLENTPELRHDIVREIRRFRPTLILTLPPHRITDGPNHINHWEHIAVGQATLIAAFPEAPNARSFPDLARDGFRPHRVSEIWIPAFEDADRFIDVSEVIDTKLAAYRCHESQNGGERWDFEDEMAPIMRAAGRKVAARYAEAYLALVTG